MSEAINRHKKKKKRRKKKLKILLTILSLFIVSLVIGGIYIYSTLNKMTAKEPGLTKEQVNKENKSNPLTFLPGKPSNPSNILILGADFVPGESTDFTKRRTDTMIIAHYDPVQDKLLGVSIPRDTKVKINNKVQKLNSANELGGPKLVIETIKDTMDIDIDYYIVIDYNGFNKIIDAIGGVDLTVPQRMKYDDETQNYHIDYQKGQEVHLDGKGAETFFRWRQNNPGIPTDTLDSGGDLGRIENQRVLIRSVIDKVSKPTIIAKIPTLLDSITDAVVTDMSPSDMLKYGLAFATIGNNNIEFMTLKGEAEHTTAWYYIYNPKKNIDLVNTLNENLPYIDRSAFNIRLVNESGRATAPISIEQSLLKNSPYTSPKITSVKGKTTISDSYVEVYDIDEKYNDIILKDFKKFNINKIVNIKGKETYDIIVHIGKDYKYSK